MFNAIAAKATAAKWSLQEKMAHEDGLETAEKLVITAIVVVLAIGVFLFIAGIVTQQASDTGASIQTANQNVPTPS